MADIDLAVDELTIVPGRGVTLLVADLPDPVHGVVMSVYTDAAGTEVAEIHLPRRPRAVRPVASLTAVTR